MSGTVSTALLLLVTAAGDGGLFESGWQDEFATIKKWQALPAWLSNPCAEARAASDGQVACFVVPNAGRGMKWGQDIPLVWVPQERFLVVRYRAEGLRTDSDDYFIYVNDKGPNETRAIRLNELVADGRWRTIGVDLEPLAETDTIKAMAIQVQATQAGGARVWLDFIRFCERLPRDCQEIRRQAQPPAKPDWWADLTKHKWAAERSWLSNPSGEHSVKREAGAVTFRAKGGGQGMKWCWFLDEDVSLVGRRYVCLRYRASGTASRGDYAICVMGSKAADGKSYTSLISPADLLHDGHWHTLTLPIASVAALFPDIKGLAVQVQCGSSGEGTLCVQKLGFVNEIAPTSAQELLAYQPGGSLDGFAPVRVTSRGKVQVASLLHALDVVEWPYGKTVTVDGIPFTVPPQGEALCAIGLRERGELPIPVDDDCSQLLLLTVAVLRGKEEEVYLRDGKITSIREIDRFRVRLEYGDGSTEECFPYNVTNRAFDVTNRAQVLCAFADSGKRLARAVLRDNTDRAGFIVVAATCRRGPRLFEDAAEEWPTVQPKADRARRFDAQPSAVLTGHDLAIRNGPLDGTISLSPFPKLVRLHNGFADDELVEAEASGALYEVSVDGKTIPEEQFKLRQAQEPVGSRGTRAIYETQQAPRIRLTVEVTANGEQEMALSTTVENLSPKVAKLGLTGPKMGRFTLGEDLSNNHYIYPKRGGLFHNRPTFARNRYGGMFPLQFMVAFNPVAASSVYLRTEDRAGTMRDYLFEKSDKGVTMWLEYPEQEVPPGGKLSSVRTVVGVAQGDWHEAFNAYTRWVKTWYKPLSPRKQWYREIFNFRQRFLHWLDPLYDAKAGDLHLGRALDEATEHFGGMEYLHIFDWGNCGKYGRIYGRTGDYSPYDYLGGGKAALKAAIAGIQKRGVPVGLYIEGYLLQEKGKLGQTHGKQWQLVGRDGERKYWPRSTEMFMCPWAPAWREVQASTYAARVAELDVDGMYLDQFGFAGSGKDCWSREHDHSRPGYSMLGERGLSTMVRERIASVKRGVALYGEEVPCDVNSQIMDGSFTYHMACSRRSQPWAPIHMARFAIPTFKTFEILVCDRPMGSWSEGVKWAFFNGEGLWLEGPATEWFQPETLATIRKCHTILRQHKDAFTSDNPTPLVQTEMAGVYANLFPTDRKLVYTLYNSRHRTVSGPVLSVRDHRGARRLDAWNDRELSTDGGIVSLSIGPRDISCIVCTLPPGR